MITILKSPSIFECFCCGGYLYPSLDCKISEEESYVCQKSFNNSCGFSIALYKKQITYCRIPFSNNIDYRYYNNLSSGQKIYIFFNEEKKLDFPFEKQTIRSLKKLVKNKNLFLQKINNLLLVS